MTMFYIKEGSRNTDKYKIFELHIRNSLMNRKHNDNYIQTSQ